MRIYLDNCSYNRPYDDLSQITVSLEAQAKLFIQEQIKNEKYELVTSEILSYEVDNCPIEIRCKMIQDYIIENSSIHVGPDKTKTVQEMARQIMTAGIKYKDACHVASAIIAECKYFISTDKRLLKYRTNKIKLVNPIEFVREMEDDLHE